MNLANLHLQQGRTHAWNGSFVHSNGLNGPRTLVQMHKGASSNALRWPCHSTWNYLRQQTS
eukprot:11181738-Lingulodinium_polyedra.AAC.1